MDKGVVFLATYSKNKELLEQLRTSHLYGCRFHMDDDPEKFDMWNAFALVTMVFMQRDYFFQKLSLTSK